MNAEAFVQGIIQMMARDASGIVEMIQKPPGRGPHDDLARISKFYNKLDEADKQAFLEAIDLALRCAMGSFLSVLDGSVSIADTEGDLELYYNDGTTRTWINSPDQPLLNEIFLSHQP